MTCNKILQQQPGAPVPRTCAYCELGPCKTLALGRMKPTTVHVLHWKHSDGSGSGITAVYMDKARAERDLVMLNEHSYVSYDLSEVDLTP